MGQKLVSTGDAARRVKISRQTLQSWIASGKINPPKARDFGKIRVRLWSEADIERLRRAKEVTYQKGRGRKKVNP